MLYKCFIALLILLFISILNHGSAEWGDTDQTG